MRPAEAAERRCWSTWIRWCPNQRRHERRCKSRSSSRLPADGEVGGGSCYGGGQNRRCGGDSLFDHCNLLKSKDAEPKFGARGSTELVRNLWNFWWGIVGKTQLREYARNSSILT